MTSNLCSRPDDDRSAVHALADIVVSRAGELEGDPAGEEGAEALPTDSAEANGYRARRRAKAEVIADVSAQASAHRAIAVRDRVVELELQIALENHGRLGGETIVELAATGDDPWLLVVAERTAAFLYQQRREVDQVLAPVAGRTLMQKLRPSDRVVERAQSECGKLAANLFGHEEKVGRDLLGCSREALAQLRPLRRDSNGAAVEVTGSHHQAALGQEQRGAEAVLVGPQ